MVSVLEWNKTMVCENMSLEVSEVVFKVSLLIILILSVLGNSAVCIIVSRHYQLRTVTNAFFVNMAAAQLLFALISIPPYLRLLSNTYSPLTNHWLCVFIGFTFEWFAASSNLALTLVIIERYFVIKHSARKKISPKGTAQLIFVAYLWTLIFAIPSTVIRGEALQCGKASPGFSLGLSCFPLLNTGKKKILANLQCYVCRYVLFNSNGSHGRFILKNFEVSMERFPRYKAYRHWKYEDHAFGCRN